MADTATETTWSPSPGKLCEMSVSVAGERHWMPVEPMSYPVASQSFMADPVGFDLGRTHRTICPALGSSFYTLRPDETLTLVRTWPGTSWSAVWVPTSLLREPVV